MSKSVNPIKDRMVAMEFLHHAEKPGILHHLVSICHQGVFEADGESESNFSQGSKGVREGSRWEFLFPGWWFRIFFIFIPTRGEMISFG